MKPNRIWDIQTGEEVSWSILEQSIISLCNEVQRQATSLYLSNKTGLLKQLEEYRGRPQPAEWARQHSYEYDATAISTSVKVKYRINKLIQHKLISETASYVLNPNPNKQEHSFSKNINLGAVDKQMVSLSWEQETNTLTLLWKCWETEYLIEFDLPEYVNPQQNKRNITKWCLPVVSSEGFKFSYEEQPQVNRIIKQNYAATDYGRLKVYHTTVVNKNGEQAAEYIPSGRLRLLNQKRENILRNKKHNWDKINKYKALNPSGSNKILSSKQQVLENQNKLLTGKAHKLLNSIANNTGAELARKLAKHNLAEHYTETLNWVSGTKQSVQHKNRGSKWGHSKISQAVEHSLHRINVPTIKISAKNNSQDCHIKNCEEKVIHNSKTRTVYCKTHKIILDRDKLSTLNQLKKTNRFPALLRKSRGYCSIKQIAVADQAPQTSMFGVENTT